MLQPHVLQQKPHIYFMQQNQHINQQIYLIRRQIQYGRYELRQNAIEVCDLHGNEFMDSNPKLTMFQNATSEEIREYPYHNLILMEKTRMIYVKILRSELCTERYKESMGDTGYVCYPGSDHGYQRCFHMSKFTKLYTLNMYSFLYIYYISKICNFIQL